MSYFIAYLVLCLILTVITTLNTPKKDWHLLVTYWQFIFLMPVLWVVLFAMRSAGVDIDEDKEE